MKKPKIQGSMLVVTMIIMGMILFISLSVSLVSIRERKASMGSGKSNSAFQTADSGVEILLQKIKEASALNQKVDQLADSDNVCLADGTIKGNMGYTVKLMDSDGNPIDCNSSTDDVSEIASIKSIGTDDGKTQQRAIEAAVAQGAGSGITGGCKLYRGIVSMNLGIMNRWGKGCKAESLITGYNTIKEEYSLDQEQDLRHKECMIVQESGYECGEESRIQTDYFSGGQGISCICVEI